jgi:mannosyltransferase OCH1-like enzyme
MQKAEKKNTNTETKKAVNMKIMTSNKSSYLSFNDFILKVPRENRIPPFIGQTYSSVRAAKLSFRKSYRSFLFF